GVNFLGDYVPDYNAITGPFLYKTFDEYFGMLETDLVKNLNKEAEEEHGIKVLGLDWVFGFRSMMTDKPIKTTEDMEGLNIRVINGVEGSIMTYYGTGQYENVKEYSLTNHLLGVSAVTISTDLWNDLSDDQKTIIEEEFQKGMEENLEETIKLEEEYEEKLKNEGVNFHEVDSKAFMDATSSVFDEFDNWTPGIYDEIIEELDKIREDLE